jgi:hypothetical protein
MMLGVSWALVLRVPSLLGDVQDITANIAHAFPRL